MCKLAFDIKNLKALFKEIGLFSSSDEPYKARVRKHQQILAYVSLIRSAFSKLSTKRPIVMLDCGCGKSYLSFALYAYCTEVLNRKVKIIGVDSNPELIKKCNESAEVLGFENMRFYSAKVGAFETAENVDIVYSLHACDSATDQTIAQGISLGAKYIFSVSCCQHSNREKMSKHPLTSISRHLPYKERLVDMIGDSMRGLLLEHLGYGVNLFEFISAEQTPKNIMLRAMKNTVKKEDKQNALTHYKKLVEMFNFSPPLENLLDSMLYVEYSLL